MGSKSPLTPLMRNVNRQTITAAIVPRKTIHRARAGQCEANKTQMRKPA